MEVVFRLDANKDVGAGHLMRCLCLAKELEKRGIPLTFATFKPNNDAIELMKKYGKIILLENIESLSFLKEYEREAKVLIVLDHYDLKIDWQKKSSQMAYKILIVDDLAKEPICADFVLNHNVNSKPNLYKNLNQSKNCSYMLGHHFALLRDEFLKAEKNIEKKFSLMISMGGADGKNQTPRVLKCLSNISFKGSILIVIGSAATNESEIRLVAKSSQLSCTVKVNSKNISYDMLSSKLCIGAGGISNYERIYLNLPTLVLATAENQVPSSVEFNARNLISYAGMWDSLSDQELEVQIENFFANDALHTTIRENSKSFIDGNGAARVVHELLDRD